MMSFLIVVVLLFATVVDAVLLLPHVESDQEFDRLLDKWSSMPFPMRRQSVAQHKAAWRSVVAVRDELRFMIDWNYVGSVSCAASGNLTARAEERLRELNSLVDVTQRRLAVLETRLKEAKRQTSVTQTELDERLRGELLYMHQYAERVRNVPNYRPQFAYQKRLLDETLRDEIQSLL
jgi:hypothetical protein